MLLGYRRGYDAFPGLGARLRSLRQQRSLTLADVASQTDITLSTISRLESGGRRPSLELLLPLARVYGVTLDELVDAPPTGAPGSMPSRWSSTGRPPSR